LATLQELGTLTVAELRKLGREKNVPLSSGLTKASIIDKLLESEREETPKPAPAPAPAAPAANARHAAIVSDEESEEDPDDVSVFMSRQGTRAVPAAQPAFARPAPASIIHSAVTAPDAAIPASAPVTSAPATANTAAAPAAAVPASNRPVFTLEGVRAWHNPRPYTAVPAGPRLPRTQWPRTQVTPAQPGTQFQPAPQPPAAWNRPQPAPAQAVQRPAPSPVSRFGPDTMPTQEVYREPDYRAPQSAAGAYQPAEPAYQPAPAAYQDAQPSAQPAGDFRARRDTGFIGKDLGTSNPAVPEMLATGDCGDGAGVLDVHADGYGFLRTGNFLPGRNDVYVSNAQIRRFDLRTGDYVVGKTRPQQLNDRYSALLYITEINGRSPEEKTARAEFEELTAIYPNKRMRLSGKEDSDTALRLIDLIAPVGFGQRAMIVAGAKTGKTALLRKIALAVQEHYPNTHVMMLLVDERPEEVTKMRESIRGEVLYSTFDEPPENHVRVSELVMERAMRLTEQGKDVVVLMDSMTRLVHAYNTLAPQTARILAGGLAAGVLNKPKRFFGVARNVRQGGSLSVFATFLSETGSRMDDVILEEFKGTGNMDLVLDQLMPEKRAFPSISLVKSGTRHEELLLSKQEIACAENIRMILASLSEAEAAGQILSMIEKTHNNDDLAARVKEWIAMMKMGETNAGKA
jgi:transcription termination factor Rho